MATTKDTKNSFVIKRGGQTEDVYLYKISSRINKLCYGLDIEHIDPVQVAIKTAGGIYKGVSTVQLDSLAAEVAASLTLTHPDYALLAA